MALVIRRNRERTSREVSNPKNRMEKLMAKTIAKLVGAVFILVGIVGFFDPHLLGAHLGKAHNVVHLVSGALSLYLGLKGSMSAAKA